MNISDKVIYMTTDSSHPVYAYDMALVAECSLELFE